jgi:toxin CcdB
MSQFDIHRNKGPRSDLIPFVVLVQSSQFDRYRRRVVVPLVRQSVQPGNSDVVSRRMNPTFTVDGIDVVLHPLDMVSVSFDQLGEYVCSCAESGQMISDALDELFTRSWG